jgi:hypothetical protein
MISTNRIAELAESAEISYEVMQYYVALMIVLVVVATLVDIVHKKSARYFFENAKKAQKNATQTVTSGEKMSVAVKTAVKDVALSGEFCSTKRRVAHLFTMYGFILFVTTTAALVFYPKLGENNTILPQLWHIGAGMLALGSWWFWLFIRVDVAAEGNKWYNVEPMDLFSLSLMATSALALTWSLTGGGVGLTFVLFVVASTILFGGVLWSKFAHMFFKPAAAFNKRMMKADGSMENLPEPADRANPEVSGRHSMLLLKDAPMDMGLGIKREAPRHY